MMPAGVAVVWRPRMSPSHECWLAMRSAISLPSMPMCARTHVRYTRVLLADALRGPSLILCSIPDLGGVPWLMSQVVFRAVWESAHMVMLSWRGCSRARAMASFSESLGVLMIPRYSPVLVCVLSCQMPGSLLPDAGCCMSFSSRAVCLRDVVSVFA